MSADHVGFPTGSSSVEQKQKNNNAAGQGTRNLVLLPAASGMAGAGMAAPGEGQ